MAAYIKQHKMQEARHLLLFANYSVAAIAEMLGYASTSHFSADFKKYFGHRPRQVAGQAPIE